ncbi:MULTISPECIES: cell envelope integrity protein CreD [Inquilinus]|uniref:Inner membrane protein n=1 Tax=Inquilinus ginsengisoli TaxID=363840 RepID=A0ABU1JLX5_9PROT|nr:cell envelope integrity protein CreD [Inquilinus ginsengisoli]MDR6289623.1 inner membrane protein [Inquilinus ginsengisoli]
MSVDAVLPPGPPPGPTVPPIRRFRAGSPSLKVLAIVMLIVAFVLPVFLVSDVIGEREDRYRSVVSEIGNSWGRPQQVTGPILVVPFRVPAERRADGTLPPPLERPLYILPDQYKISASAAPETRRRGLFEAVVYSADLDLSGQFLIGDAAALAGPEATIDWASAYLYVGVADPRSIREGASLRWGGHELPFQPGAPGELGQSLGAGMTLRVPGLTAESAQTPIPFATTLRLNGSERIDFLPLGRSNQVTASSNWPDPSFDGAFLPVRTTIGSQGFTAEWELSYFGRGYPQAWVGGDGSYLSAIASSAFGARFFQPVNAYQQTQRSAKYGMLFIVFTFTLFFLFETVARLRIHVFQYGLVGLSLCLFYLLLLSFAEQVGFAGAYGVGTAAVVVQIVLYCRPVLGTWKRSAVLGALLAILYGTLYALMQLEDLALLLGSIGLFLALSAVMYTTRKIDWYAAVPSPVDPAGPTA